MSQSRKHSVSGSQPVGWKLTTNCIKITHLLWTALSVSGRQGLEPSPGLSSLATPKPRWKTWWRHWRRSPDQHQRCWPTSWQNSACGGWFWHLKPLHSSQRRQSSTWPGLAEAVEGPNAIKHKNSTFFNGNNEVHIWHRTATFWDEATESSAKNFALPLPNWFCFSVMYSRLQSWDQGLTWGYFVGLYVKNAPEALLLEKWDKNL